MQSEMKSPVTSPKNRYRRSVRLGSGSFGRDCCARCVCDPSVAGVGCRRLHTTFRCGDSRQEISRRRIRDVTSATILALVGRRNCHVDGMTDIAHSAPPCRQRKTNVVGSSLYRADAKTIVTGFGCHRRSHKTAWANDNSNTKPLIEMLLQTACQTHLRTQPPSELLSEHRLKFLEVYNK